MIVFHILVLLSLLLIAFQDFKVRGVYWIIFPVLALFLGIIKSYETGLDTFMIDAMVSGAFVGFQLLCLAFYLSIRFKGGGNFPSHYLGWGDILFFVAMCFYFPPLVYVCFYIGSLIIAILYAMFQKMFYKDRFATIPLAGIQAVLLLIVLATQWFVSNIIYDHVLS